MTVVKHYYIGFLFIERLSRKDEGFTNIERRCRNTKPRIKHCDVLIRRYNVKEGALNESINGVQMRKLKWVCHVLIEEKIWQR